MQAHLSMVTLGVRDLARAVRFYEEGLGLPRLALDNEAVAFFPLAGAWLSLFGRDALAADAGVTAEGAGFSGISLAHNVGSREAVDATLAQAVAAGGTLVKAGQDVFWGGYSGYFSDPDGHLWEVAWNPFMQVGPSA